MFDDRITRIVFAAGFGAMLAGGALAWRGFEIENNGTPLTKRETLNYASGISASDDAPNQETDITADTSVLYSVGGTTHARGDMPTAVAYEDESNFYTESISLQDSGADTFSFLIPADITTSNAVTVPATGPGGSNGELWQINGSGVASYVQHGAYSLTSDSPASSPDTLTVAECTRNQVHTNSTTATIEFDMPADGTGAVCCFRVDQSGTLTVDPNATDQILVETATGGNAISSTAVGATVCLFGVSASSWAVETINDPASWTDAG